MHAKMTQVRLIRQFKGYFSFRKSQEQQKVVSCRMSARRFDHMYKMSARRFDHISSDATTDLLRAVDETFIHISWSRAFVPTVHLDMDALASA